MAKKKYNLGLFVGQYVEVVTTTTLSASSEAEGGYIERKQPMILSGIFLDHDDEMVYLGTEEGALSDTIAKRHCVHIGVAKEKDKYDDMLDAAEDKTGFHT